MEAAAEVPVWLKVAYAAFLPVLVAVYWRAYGPSNFLWLSDVALALTALSVITEHRIFASMAAVGILPLEVLWSVDFAARGRLLGLSAYMFDRALPLYLRALSLFHLALPPTLLFLLWRLGYDERAFGYQAVLTAAILLTCYLATDPQKNINWVFGPGNEPQRRVPPLLYLAGMLLLLSLAVMLPLHLLFLRIF